MVSSKRPVAVVTGAARSLGRAISETLHGQGYAVALCDVDDTEAAKVAASLDPAGQSAKAYKLDVSNAAQVTAVMDAVAGDLGVPSALVNNAGVYPDHALLDMPEAAWDRVLDVNLKGPFLCSQAFGRKRVAAGGGGAIVNLASTAGFSARVGAAHYSASKAGVVMLTKSMAQELGPHGIRVNAVAPGFIEVREDQVSPAYKQQMIGLIPLGRPGKAPNIANTVAFLLSDAAEFITGECIVVDGGLLTGRPLVRSGSL
ncbi:MAG: SDR family NAD(P)-dependent oxidoreductase [Hyphomicrobiaceae bacterium]